DFVERPDLGPALSMEWNARGEYVVDALTETAERTQKRVRAYLDDRRVPYQAFWIDNLITVETSSFEVFEGLLAFAEIEVLRARRTMGLVEPAARAAAPSDGRAAEPNLTHVNADQVWALGVDGAGVVVANIDTGVRYTHEALEPHYRGNLGGGAFDHDYNWLSGTTGAAAPEDDHGHGSHTMGTMIGDDGGSNQVGMAPGATWIACDACQSTGCPDAALLTCAQWIAAPYPVGDPGSPDPSKRPHVVNNSWGDCGNSYDNWYQASVDSWHAAGVYPVFSNGNASNCGYSSPPGCNTVGNPARYGNVTGVGSTGQSNGAYATHSNWGPTDNVDAVNPNGFPTIKPQVAAPGVDIRSSLNGSDSQYASWAGTSMSAPHVAGLIALMWDAGPCLIGDYATTEDLILGSAVAIPYASSCGGEGPGNVPNQATGWGEIDALAAVTDASAYCNTDWLPWVSESPTTGQIASGASEDVTLTFTCDAAPADETGTLRLTSNDPCATTVDIPLTLHCTDDPGSADLAVTKTDGQASAVPGSGTGYTIVVSNGGPGEALGAAVADTFPAALTGATWTCVGSGGATCTAAGSGDLADTVDLPFGSSVTYSVTATIDPGATGAVINTATVTPPSGVPDPNPGNNSATDTTTLTPEVDLQITKTDGLTSAASGDPVTYTVTAVNPGPSDAPGALVTDTFPAEVIGLTWTCAASGGAACAPSGAGDISETVDLPAGGSVVYTATGSFANSAAGTVANTATVTAPPGVTELDFSNNLATDTTDVVAVAELHGRITDARCWVLPGESTTYTLEVFNDGPADAMGSLVDTYAWPVTLTGAPWTCTPTGGASCPASGTGDIFTAVDLPAGSSMVFSLTGTVDPGASGWLITAGYVAPNTGVIDPTPDNAEWFEIDALEPPVFCDGFDIGTTGGWTATVP
ncbi:MAG: S8 family serine peptidase, partial [Candidatus Sulfomarinibacteraceae bacterium]